MPRFVNSISKISCLVSGSPHKVCSALKMTFNSKKKKKNKAEDENPKQKLTVTVFLFQLPDWLHLVNIHFAFNPNNTY